MALAIPIQGVAAVGMKHCQGAPGSVQQLGSDARHDWHDQSGGYGHPHHGDPHQHPQGHHGHHAMSGSAHAAAHDHADLGAAHAQMADDEGPTGAGATEDASGPSPQAAKVPGVDKKCSACAACCAAAALPSHVAEVPVLDLVSTPASLTEHDSVSFIASGPERPPRSHLA